MPGLLVVMLVALCLALSPVVAGAAGVQAQFDLKALATAPFPSDWFTVPDDAQLTGRRVNLPTPNCGQRPSDCADVAILNTLDGFNVQPRISIPFTGPIEPGSVTSDTVFLVDLGDAAPAGSEHARGRRAHVIGINQRVWDPVANVLHVESDALLDQHARYALVVTDGIRDAAGDPVIASPAFARFRQTVDGPYKSALLEGMQAARLVGVPENRVVALSVFTTQSVTAVLEKIRDQIKGGVPAPARFDLGSAGQRTVFPRNTVTSITFNRQIAVSPPGFAAAPVPISVIDIVPDAVGAVGLLAFGSYRAPTYITPDRVMPPIATGSGVPAVLGDEEIFFNLTVPAGTPPPGGWPVVIFGHGANGTKNGAGLYTIAAKMAKSGLAVVEINVVGHGGGPLGTLTVNRNDGPAVTFPAGGRGVDLNGDRAIDTAEGLRAIGPNAIVGVTDGLRQTIADLMQLVRVIEVGVDVDGDGVVDLDPSRIYYFGQSLGGIYAVPLHALDPSVRASVVNVPGGPIVDIQRLGPLNRPPLAQTLGARIPSLLNAGATFNDNIPLRDVPPVVNTVPGAMDLQAFIDRLEWVSQTTNAVAWAPHLREASLDDVPVRPVILHMAKTDQTNPNPTTTAILRAGNLADLTTYYRHDLAFADNPARLKNPHLFPFLTTDPTMKAISLGIQDQVAAFLASDGFTVLHPTPEQYFEVPIAGPLPETLNFIP